MMNVLFKQFKKRYLRYSLIISLSFFIIGIIFFILALAQNEVANSMNTSNGDIGFGYAASGVISIILSLFISVSVIIIYFFNKKGK